MIACVIIVNQHFFKYIYMYTYVDIFRKNIPIDTTLFFFSFLNQMEYDLVQNQKENCHHDHIPFNLKGNGNVFFRVFFSP